MHRAFQTGNAMSLLALAAALFFPMLAQAGIVDDYRAITAKIIAEATTAETGTQAWERAAELTDICALDASWP